MSEWWENEPPVTEEEEVWARAYWEHLAVGDPYPDREGFDQRRLGRIEEVLLARWKAKVRRITHQPGRSSRK